MGRESLYSEKQAKEAIWVCLEQEEDRVTNVSLELLTKGRQLADSLNWPLTGLLLSGSDLSPIDPAFEFGADEVLLVKDGLLEKFRVETYSKAAFETIINYKPSIILFGATPNMRDLAGRLAVRLRTGLNADCTNLEINKENGVLVCQVSGFGEGVLALIEMESHRPQMATVRPGVFQMRKREPVERPRPTQFSVNLDPSDIYTNIIEQSSSIAVDLTQIPVIIAGGRGIDGDFGPLEELANLLGGEIGATRPPVDEGHIDRERQIGQTGVVCRPKLVVTCGISGAFHFIVGIQDSETVIAINNDPKAPIFEHADYCVVGDVHEIIPQLIDLLRDSKSSVGLELESELNTAIRMN
jgi:electron transfer flavoprotein alpha subunit